jgi:hypothetical protein
MEALLGAGLAVGACCGLPLLLIGGAALLDRRKGNGRAAKPSKGRRSLIHACCEVPLSATKGALALVSGKRTQHREHTKIPR